MRPTSSTANAYQQMQRPVSAAIFAAALLTVGLAAFAAGAWSTSQRCNYYRLASGVSTEGQASVSGSSTHVLTTEEALVDIPEPTQFVKAFPENRGAAHEPQNIQLREEVLFLRRKVYDLRLAYGNAHCAKYGIGPTGGFCVGKDKPMGTVSGTFMDETMCKALGQLITGQRVADLGAGRGQYGKCLKDFVRQYVPYDGSEGVQEATDGVVRFLDLSEPTWLGITFDWVMSLEVGEHIPVEQQDTFIGNVLRHAERGVVLSWAIPGQGGHHHVNEQPNDYIVGRVLETGKGAFVLNETASAVLRGASSLPWFKKTIMVFDRIGRS